MKIAPIFKAITICITIVPFLFTVVYAESNTNINHISVNDIFVSEIPIQKNTAASSDTVTIMCNTNPAGRSYKIDGVTYSTSKTFKWIVGSYHIVGGNTIQKPSWGTKHILNSFTVSGFFTFSVDDTLSGYYETPIQVPDFSLSITANFKTEYCLALISAHGKTRGAGWYSSGSTANFSISAPENTDSSRYQFLKWSGDYSGTNPESSTIMNRQKAITAKWSVEHMLSINSAWGTPEGAGWYQEGETATFSISSPVNYDSLRYCFNRWSGHYNGSEPVGSILMDTPKTIDANWQKEYYLNVISNFGTTTGSGWYLENDTVEFSIDPIKIQTSNESRLLFDAWTGAGKNSYNGPDSSHSVIIKNSVTEEANWKKQFKLTTSDVPPEGGHIIVEPQKEWFDAFSKVTIDAAINDDFDWLGWSGDITGIEKPIILTIDTSKNIISNYSAKEYSLIISIDPENAGTITKIPSKSIYQINEVVQLVATPNFNFLFKQWSGDIISDQDTVEIIMDSTKILCAHFSQKDIVEPALIQCFPVPNSKSVPQNTPISFIITDPDSGSGINSESIQITINQQQIVNNGLPDTSFGIINLASTANKAKFHYIPKRPYVEESTVIINVLATDLAIPANSLDSTFTFFTSKSKVHQTHIDTVSVNGDTVICNQTNVQVTIPEGALPDTTEIGIGTIENPPAIPDSIQQMGISYHFWPDGLQFNKPVTISIPYTNLDLQAAGVQSPCDLTILYYSSLKGEWIQVEIIDTDSNYIYISVTEFCYFMMAKTNNTSTKQKNNLISLPKKFVLKQNYPNPFNPETRIAFDVPQAENVTINIYNISGQKVRTLFNGIKQPGSYEVIWDGHTDSGQIVPSGIYLYIMQTESTRKIMKASFLK